MKFSKIQSSILVALLISNAIILFTPLRWGWLRWPNAVLFSLVLPGLAWPPLLRWLHTPRAIERIVLVFGASTVLVGLLLYGVVLLPGPFTEPPVLVAINLLIIAGVVAQFRARGDALPLQWPPRRVLLILLAITAVAAFTRLYGLGYSEFHEDELENMRLIVRAFKGEEFVPFIDSKGPIHWLLPAGLWYTNGWVNEALARLPFAVASVLLVPLMFALGRRLSGGRDNIGLLAAGFVALNGFYVALARHVENRVLIVFWGALAVWLAYRAFTEKRTSLLLMAALVLAVGFIAHPTVIFYVPAVAFAGWLATRQAGASPQKWLWPSAAVALFVGVSALFYVPYLLNPALGQTVQYFADERVGTEFLYNRVNSLLSESELYSSWFYGPFLVLLALWLMGRNFAQLGGKGIVLFGVLLALMLSVSWLPAVWVVGAVNVAFVPFTVAALVWLLLPRTPAEVKLMLLWFAVPFGGLLFLAQDASNHIQIAYTGLIMLAVLGLDDLWALLNHPAGLPRLGWGKRVLKVGLVLVPAVVAPLILLYQYLQFNAPVITYWQVKTDYTENPNSVYAWLYGSIPRPRKVISNPRLGGWKAVGYLWETGQLGGDFRSINESFAVPIWYTYQTPRSCYTDPENYWVRRDLDGWPSEETQLVDNGYSLTRVVLVDNQPKLHLFERTAAADAPEILNVNDYRAAFDVLATPARFAQDEDIGQAASLNFGDKLLLRGFTLSQTVSPGTRLPVLLYWQALAPMEIRYRAFVHLIGPDGATIGQHDDDPGCRLITPDMRPGMPSARQFRVPVDPQTPPGEYLVVIGVYHPDTFARLPIWDNQAQNSPGDSFVIGTVRVE